MKILHQTDDHPTTRTRKKAVLGLETILDHKRGIRSACCLSHVESGVLMDFAYFESDAKKRPWFGWHEGGHDYKCPGLLVQPNGVVHVCDECEKLSGDLDHERLVATVLLVDERRRCRNCSDYLEPKKMGRRGKPVCLDSRGCAERFKLRCETNPAFARLVAFRVEDPTSEEAHPKRVSTSAREVKPSRACECGCGEMTKGGRYRPGHDARHHAKLKREEARGDVS